MQATYWCFGQLSAENKAWLFGLPHQVELAYAVDIAPDGSISLEEYRLPFYVSAYIQQNA